MDCKNTNYLLVIKDKIDRNYNFPINISDLAKREGVTESKLQHEFPLRFGINIQNYHSETSINNANELLGTFNSIKRIAFLVVYKSKESFSRALQKIARLTHKQ